MSNYKVKLYNKPRMSACEIYLLKDGKEIDSDNVDYILARIFIAKVNTYHYAGGFEIECYDKTDYGYKLVNKVLYSEFNDFINIGYENFLNKGNMDKAIEIKKFLIPSQEVSK